MNKITRRSFTYQITVWILLFVSIGILLWLNAKILSNPIYIPVDDFSHYWAAGHLSLEDKNPYDPIEVQKVKNQISGLNDKPQTVAIMWTPPWSLPVVMPFGLLDYPISRVMWLLFCVGIILVSATEIWKFYSGPSRSTWIAWVIAFSFTPTISVLEKGQITPVLLAGIIGFLIFIERKQNEWIAGVFVALISIKPQLFYLLWLALLLWIIKDKKWKVLISIVLTVLGLTSIALILNHQIIQQYLWAVFSNTPTVWASPNLGSYLRQIFGIEKTWLQFLPMALGVGWFLFYYAKRGSGWVWSEQIPILILVSFLLGGYGWTYDQVLSLVAVIPAFILVRESSMGFPKAGVITLFIFINVINLFLHRNVYEVWFGWLAPAFLLWYLLALRLRRIKIATPLTN